MMKKFHIVVSKIIIFFYFLVLVNSVKADTLYLNNGDILSGKIITLSEGICVFDSQYGSSFKIPSKDIKGLSTDNSYNISFSSGEMIKGQFIMLSTGGNKIRSENFGDLPVPTSQMISMVKVFPSSTKTKNSQKTDATQVQTNTSPKKYGEETEEDPPLDFLTGSTVLLSPGTFELEFDMGLRTSRSEYKLTQVGYFQRSSYSARMFEMGLTARAGLMDRMEGWFRVPVTYSTVEDVSTNEYVRSKSSWDFGDLGFGLQYLILKESENIPAVSVSLAASAPTGQKSYRRLQDTWQDALDNGSGHWALKPGISFVRTVDPAILYGGIEYQYSFERNIDGYDIKPGDGIIGYLGLGFALNEKLSLGSRMSVAHYSELTADGVTVKGSGYDPMDLSFTFSYRAWENFVISPHVTFGLNDDSGAPSVGVRFTKRF